MTNNKEEKRQIQLDDLYEEFQENNRLKEDEFEENRNQKYF